MKPMYDVAIARKENTSTIGCKIEEIIFFLFFYFDPFLIVYNRLGREKSLLYGKNGKLTPTIPLLERNCCSGSVTLTPFNSRFGIVPRITASQMRNKMRGIAVPRTIEVLQKFSK